MNKIRTYLTHVSPLVTVVVGALVLGIDLAWAVLLAVVTCAVIFVVLAFVLRSDPAVAQLDDES